MDSKVSKPAGEDSMRGKLLLAAIEQFNRQGYAATTVRGIVEAVGVTKPVLYYYFGSKEGIYLAIMQEALEHYLAGLDAPLSSESARDRIIALCQRTFEMSREHVGVARLIHAVFYGPQQGAPHFDIDQFHQAFVDRLQLLVEQGISLGELCVESVADAVMALLGAATVCMEFELVHPECSIGGDGVARVLNVVFDGAAAHRAVAPHKERQV